MTITAGMPVDCPRALISYRDIDARVRLTQRGSGFPGDVGAAAEANVVEAGAVAGEGDDRGVGDVLAAEVNGSEAGPSAIGIGEWLVAKTCQKSALPSGP